MYLIFDENGDFFQTEDGEYAVRVAEEQQALVVVIQGCTTPTRLDGSPIPVADTRDGDDEDDEPDED